MFDRWIKKDLEILWRLRQKSLIIKLKNWGGRSHGNRKLVGTPLARIEIEEYRCLTSQAQDLMDWNRY